MNINNGLVPLILLIINCISLLDISEILIIQARDNCDKLGTGKFWKFVGSLNLKYWLFK